MTHNKLISVFLPYYNDKKYISEAIQSVLTQTYSNFELILFNHASEDGSRDIARSFIDKRIIHLDAEKNLGAGSGLNLSNSLSIMSGEYLKILCADDSLESSFFEKTVNYLEENRDKSIVYSDAWFVDGKSNKNGSTWFQKWNFSGYGKKEVLKILFNRGMPPCFSAGLYMMNDIKKIKIDKSFVVLVDVYILTALLINGGGIGFINEPLVNYRLHENQMVPSDDFFGKYMTISKKGLLHIQQTSFESLEEINIFYHIQDIEILRYIMPSSKYTGLLTEKDVDFFPFLIAHYLLDIPNHFDQFASCQDTLIYNGYINMYKIMDNDEMRNKIKEKFNFDISDFRKMYATQIIPFPSNCNLINIKKSYDDIINSRSWRYALKARFLFRKMFPKL